VEVSERSLNTGKADLTNTVISMPNITKT